MSAKKKNTKKNTSKSAKSTKKTNKKVKKVSPAYVDKLPVEATITEAEVQAINTEPSVDAITPTPVIPETANFETTNIDNNNSTISGSVELSNTDNNIVEQSEPAQDDIVYKEKTSNDIYTSYPSNNNKDIVLIVAAIVFFAFMFVMLAL